MSETLWLPYLTRHDAGLPGCSLVGGPRKAVAHKTQSDSQDPDALFKRTTYWPHFLIGPDVAYQFLPLNVGSYALANKAGGVETNRAGSVVAQVEIVGWSGTTMDHRTADRVLSLQKMLRDLAGVPWVWPAGRPPTEGGGARDTGVWNHDGWFSHSQVPENDHTDPAYTDLEWWVLNQGMNT